MPRLTEDTALKLVMIAALLGLIDSVYLTYLHHLVVDLGGACPTAGLPGLDCGEVLIWEDGVLWEKGALFGLVPVAWLGLAGFAGVIALALDRFLAADLPRTRYHIAALGGMAALGTALGCWLTYLELFVIHEICPFCFTAFVLMLFIDAVLLLAFAPRRTSDYNAG